MTLHFSFWALLFFLGCWDWAEATPSTQSTGAAASTQGPNHHQVLILGGGVAGVIAARTLHSQGIEDFVIVEARDELGGRMMTRSFGGKVIEQGPNWIQGTQEGDGPANPILVLANKHGLKSQFNDWFGSVCEYASACSVTSYSCLTIFIMYHQRHTTRRDSSTSLILLSTPRTISQI